MNVGFLFVYREMRLGSVTGADVASPDERTRTAKGVPIVELTSDSFSPPSAECDNDISPTSPALHRLGREEHVTNEFHDPVLNTGDDGGEEAVLTRRCQMSLFP
jgi:hypothetical protein